jgi:hypothetical protein
MINVLAYFKWGENVPWVGNDAFWGKGSLDSPASPHWTPKNTIGGLFEC